MDANELNRMDYLAAVRLSDVGYRRYERERAKVLQHMKISEARKALETWINAWEARELRLSLMVRCAPLNNPLQLVSHVTAS